MLRIAAAIQVRLRPGQALLGVCPDKGEPTRSQLIPLALTDGGFECAAPADRHWQGGDSLDLLGPIGTGFTPPLTSRRWLLLGLEADVGPLMPLIPLGRRREASISVWAEASPADLPPDVELAPDLPTAIDWSDYLAVCATPSGLSELRSVPGLTDPQAPGGVAAEVLLVGPMPCGIGGCMACAVRARRGWKLRCQDGPVISLQALAW